MNPEIALFEGKRIRKIWLENEGTWYFSVVDVVGILSESADPTDYLKKIRKRDAELGNYLGTNCHQVEMITSTGKKRKTLAGTVEQILRVVQSIPSPNAEPFKLWLAKVGYERIEEIQDPERALNRSREFWQKLGRSDKWIQQRMMGQETRNKLIDYWKDHEIKEQNEFAILTNVIHKEWSDVSVKQHKELKGLKTENLRDHMSDAELIFTALAELSTRQIAETEKAIGFDPNKDSCKKGGGIAKRARTELESNTGKSIVTGKNFLSKQKKEIK